MVVGWKRLSSRQGDVLRLVAEGHSDKQIAAELGLSLTTVKTHLCRIYRHNGFRNRAEAAAAWSVRLFGPAASKE